MTEHTVFCTPYEWSDGTPAVAIGAATGPDVMIAKGKFSVGDAEGNSYYDAEDIDPLIASLEKAREVLLADRAAHGPGKMKP